MDGDAGASGRTALRAVALAVGLAVGPILAGCGENYSELARRQHAQVTEWVRNLGAALDRGLIRNANVIKRYAEFVRRDRPEVAALAAELAREGTTAGLAYSSLTGRLGRVDLDPAGESEADRSLEELLRIEAAADVDVFNDSLIDVANVLADLSQGRLPRLHIPSAAPRAETGPGSHLVGNPRYGEWRESSGGGSFWAFYGQYALMRDLFFTPRAYSYGDWYPRRGWSYYGDVGRHYYGARADSQRWERAATTRGAPPRRSYGPLRSQRRLSTYGRSAGRSPGAATRRASSYGRTSAYGGSARGGLRAGGFRGK